MEFLGNLLKFGWLWELSKEAWGPFLGAWLAFHFGMRQQDKQHERHIKLEAEALKERRITRLNFEILCIGQNIMALVEYKKQMILPAVEEIKRAQLAFSESPEQAVIVLSKCEHLFKVLPKGDFLKMHLPDAFDFAIDKEPLLIPYLHTARQRLVALDDQVESWNRYVWHSLEANGKAVDAMELRQLIQMTISLSNGLLLIADLGLAYLLVGHDKLRDFGKSLYPDQKFVRTAVLDAFKKFLPSDDLIAEAEAPWRNQEEYRKKAE